MSPAQIFPSPSCYEALRLPQPASSGAPLTKISDKPTGLFRDCKPLGSPNKRPGAADAGVQTLFDDAHHGTFFACRNTGSGDTKERLAMRSAPPRHWHPALEGTGS